MERQNSHKPMLDDTEPLFAIIESTANTQGHTDYLIKVQRGPEDERNWQIRRRFNDFVALNGALQISALDLPLPPKKMFGNMDREFISVRQQGLQNYLNTVLSNLMLANSLHVKRFLDPVNYLENFQEKALQHVFMMFRCEPNWSMAEALPEIGWRIRRNYFTVRHVDEEKQDYIMSWCNYGPDVCLTEKEFSNIMRTLSNMNHPLIASPRMASADKTGGTIVHAFAEDGSLRDLVCKSKPTASYLKKYCNPKGRTPLPSNDVIIYAKQILEALKFLHARGFPYGHLHLGNVMRIDGICRLMGLENSFFGLPPYYRTFASQLRKVKTLKDLDVYSFGHIMYEMVFGTPLNSATCDNYPLSCPPTIKSVLESILTTEACKGGLPSIENLLTHPLFSNVQVSAGYGKGHLKVTPQLKELFRVAQSKVEARLLQDQKKFRQIQRLSKVQSILLEETRAPKKNHLFSKKMVRGGSQDGRSASPAGSEAENGSASAPTPPPPPPQTIEGPSKLQTNGNVNSVQPKPNKVLSSNSSGNENNSTLDGIKSSPAPTTTTDRSLLLGSITSFKRDNLRKTVTKDRSKLKI